MKLNNKYLGNYAGEFELDGRLKIADENRQSRISFRTIYDYEAYINVIDQDYESEDVIYSGYIYKKNSHFNKVNRSQYGN